MQEYNSQVTGWLMASGNGLKGGNAQATTLNMHHDEILKRARLKAAEGRATEMTLAEMDAFREWSEKKSEAHAEEIRKRQEEARRKFSEKERDIFSFVRREFNKLDANEGYDPDKHDELVLSKAAARFGITKDEAKLIFWEVDGAGLDLK